MADLILDFFDLDGRNIDVVALDEGAVEVRIFRPGTSTTSRRVVLPPDIVLELMLELAAHLRDASREADREAV